MRFWLTRTAATAIMSVDNASVTGMDYSALPSNVRLVEWRDAGDGEIEYNDRPPLREQTFDVIPYCPYFDQFLTKLTGVTLAQAKKVKRDLIAEIYETKRQLPFHYPVAAGDYWWDASDDNMASSVIPSVQNSIASINSIVASLNTTIPAISTKITGSQTQLNLVNNAASGLKSEINAGLITQINAILVSAINAISGQFYACVVAPGNSLISYLNDTVLGYLDLPANTVNAKLQAGASIGLTTDIVHHLTDPFNGYGSGASATNLNFMTTPFPSNITVAGVPWTPLVNVPLSNSGWIPVGGTVPVTVTPAEAAAIMQGIAARSNDLSIKKNTKIGEVNALTTVAAVIAYDVTAGW